MAWSSAMARMPGCSSGAVPAFRLPSWAPISSQGPKDKKRALELLPGFLELTTTLAQEAAEASSAGPVLYIHMEFHGGQGTHDAVGWRDGTVAFGPLFTKTPRESADEQYVATRSGRDMAINAGLRWLGVTATQ